MRNIKVTIAYRGTAYHGFQRQINSVGVQNVIEDTLTKIFNSGITINGCSRTDTGVHANMFCFSFLTENELDNGRIKRGLNGLLPDDIAVMSVEDVSLDFHARYSCKGKEYIYKIYNNPVKNPFYSDLALHYTYETDIEKMRSASKYYAGTHDFTSFCGTANQKENSVRTIEYFNIDKQDDFIIMSVKGDGFLYNMVRIMVGTLLMVNENKIGVDEIPKIIEARDRCKAGRTAKAHGLYLNRVFY